MRHGRIKIKTYMPIPLFVVGTVAIAVLLADNANLDNTAYGQSLLFPNAQNSSASPNPSPILQHYQQQRPPLPNQLYQSNLHFVKITLPTKGQQVLVGKDLLIYGTSAGNTTSGCKVSVKANNISPYHDASPGGHNDYSKWNFTLSPAYTAIKQGQNKITAKFACSNEPTLASHYSVNVTGVGTGTTPIGPSHQFLQPTLSTNGGVNSAAANTTATSTTNAIHAFLSKHSPVNNNNHRVSLISLSIRIGKSSVHPGDTEILTIMAVDKNSTKAITGGSVLGNISSSSGLLKKFKGATDNNGKASYSWKVSSRDITGKYKVIAQIYSPAYESKTASKTFKVTSLPVMATSPSSTNYNSLTSSNDARNNNNSNTSNAAHNNNSINKNRHQHTLPIDTISSGNSNSSLTPSSHAHGTNNNTKKSNLATSNASHTAHSNNSKNQNIHHPTPTITPDHPFGVPISHVPFAIP